MRDLNHSRDYGWPLVVAGIAVWIVALALRGPDLVSAVLGVGVLFVTYVLCARRWRPQALPAAWRGPTTTSSGLLVLGLALSEVGLVLRHEGLPTFAATALFILALTLLVGSVVTAYRTKA